MRVSMSENPNLARRCKAFLNGIDVSKDCFEADDDLGYVKVYKKDEDERRYREGDEAAWERKWGEVRIEVGA